MTAAQVAEVRVRTAEEAVRPLLAAGHLPYTVGLDVSRARAMHSAQVMRVQAAKSRPKRPFTAQQQHTTL